MHYSEQVFYKQQPNTNMMTRLLHGVLTTLMLMAILAAPMYLQAQGDTKVLNKVLKKADAAYGVHTYLEASNYYQQVLALDPNHYHSIYRMALISNHIQDYREAQRWFRKAIETDPERNDTAYLELGLVYKKLNNYMKAKESFLMFQRKHPAQDDEYYLRAENEIKGCDFAESESSKKPPYRVDTVSFNSTAIDALPAYLDQRQEDKFVIFTSHRKAKDAKAGNGGYEGLNEEAFSDLYMVVMEDDSTFGAEIINMGAPINTPMNDGGASYTGDGLTMYYTICNQGKKKGYECSVYETRYDYAAKKWSKPVALQGVNGVKNVVVNSKGKTKTVPCFDTQPYISGDGMTLVFVSDRDGGRGDKDIWVSHRTGEGWSAPENAGEFINTPFGERSPMLNEDATVLYFASEGGIGFGGYDLYRAELIDGIYQNPVNLGSPINSSYDDYGMMRIRNGEGVDSTLLFTSNRPGGAGRDDIYRANYIVYPYPPVTVAVQGTIRDKKTKQPVPFATAVLFEVQEDGSLVELNKMSTDQKARYSFELEIEKDYKVVGNAEGYYANESKFTTKGLGTGERGGDPIHHELERNIDIQLEEIVIGPPVVLQNIYYDYDKYYIRPDAAFELDKLVELLKKNPNITIQLGSHTDTNGSENYNKTLSEKRAMAAVKYLYDKGIDPGRLGWYGFGESAPIFAPEKSDEEEQVNRRTEFRITSIDYVPKATFVPNPVPSPMPVPQAPMPTNRNGVSAK